MIEIYGWGNNPNFNKNLINKNKEKSFDEQQVQLLTDLDNLPTLDPDCLSLLYYLQLTHVNYTWHTVSHPSISPTGELPMLKSGLLFISGLDKIIQWLKSEGYNLDDHLESSQKLYCLSYSKMFGDYLKDGWQYYIYQDEDNFINWTRPLLGKLLTIPMNYVTPGYLINESKKRLNFYYLIHEAENTSSSTTQKVALALKYYRNTKKADSSLTVEFKILSQVQNVYSQIESKLGDQSYLFGDRISSADLIVASYLLCQSNPIWSNATLYNHLIKNHPKLIDYAVRVNGAIGSINPQMPPTSKWYDLSHVKNFISNQFRPQNPTSGLNNFNWESMGYVGLGLASLVTYAIYHGFIRFVDESVEQGNEEEEERVGYTKELEGPPKLPIMRDDSEDESDDDDDDD